MRQYRGKRVDNGDWVYGYLHEYITDSHFYNKLPVHRSWILSEHSPDTSGWEITDTFNEFEVIPETVGQATGRKEVYEGDVFTDKNNAGYTVEIAWDNLFSQYRGFNINQGLNVPLTDVLAHMEKIGNIHDNPELLEE